MKNLLKYYLIIIYFLFSSCALDVPEDAFEYLAPPVITGVTKDDTYIYVSFTGSNDEYYFDGYNVYISDTAMLRTSVASYARVQIDEEGYASAVPSYPTPPDGSQADTIRLNEYWGAYDLGPYPFEKNVTYWIMLCSHYSQTQPGVNEDGVSNQVSITF